MMRDEVLVFCSGSNRLLARFHPCIEFGSFADGLPAGISVETTEKGMGGDILYRQSMSNCSPHPDFEVQKPL